MTVPEAVRLFDDASRNVSGSLAAAMSLVLGDALTKAQEFSSGGLSSETLARMGHPYRIGGSPPQDPAIINRQTGDFYRAWRIADFVASGDRFSGAVINDDPKVRFLKGTRKMIPRPIVQAVSAELAPMVTARVTEALVEVLR